MAIQVTKPLRHFVDLSLAFSPHPLTGDLPILRDTRAINASLKNCVMIGLREKPFNRDFGSQVNDLLFDLFDMGTESMIEDAIGRAIKNNEPRVKVKEVLVEARPEQNDIKLEVHYSLAGYEETFIYSDILSPTR